MWETPVRHRTALLAALLASTATVVSIACGPARASAAPKPQPLATELAADMARLGAVSWSASKPLEWNDFIGPAPSTGSEGALTVYSLFHGLRCTGRTFEFLVTAGFLPSRSWVKPNVLNDRDLRGRTLLHEQTHFDISEVHARRILRHQ